MKALRFMGYNRNHQTAESELTQEQYSTQTTEHRHRTNEEQRGGAIVMNGHTRTCTCYVYVSTVIIYN